MVKNLTDKFYKTTKSLILMKKNRKQIVKDVALCFSGQVKNLELCYPYIKKNLLDYLGSYDIFCCAEDDSNVKKIKILKPKKSVKVKSSEVDKIIKAELKELRKQNYKTSIFPESFRFNPRNTYQQLYKISQSFEILEKYMKEENVSYKYFIRIRFDFLPLDVIKLASFNLKKKEVVVPDIKIPHPKDLFNDMVYMAKDFDTFKSCCSLYQNFRKTIEQELSIKPTLIQKLYFFLEKNYLYFFLFLFKKLNKNQRRFPRVFFGFALLLPKRFYKEFKAKNRYGTEKVFFYYLKSEKISIKKKKIDFVIVRSLTEGFLIFGKE